MHVTFQGDPLYSCIFVVIAVIVLYIAIAVESRLTGWHKLAKKHSLQGQFKGQSNEFRAVRMRRNSWIGFLIPGTYLNNWVLLPMQLLIALTILVAAPEMLRQTVSPYFFLAASVFYFLFYYCVPMFKTGYSAEGIMIAPSAVIGWLMPFHKPLFIRWHELPEVTLYEKNFFGWHFVPSQEAWAHLVIDGITILVSYKDYRKASDQFTPATCDIELHKTARQEESQLQERIAA